MALQLWRRYIRRPSRYSLLFLPLLGIVLMMDVFNISYVSFRKLEKASDLIQNDIIKLSEKYVRALALENTNVVDGPYAGRFTAYDLKTINVLLENLQHRQDRIEALVNYIAPNQSLTLQPNHSLNPVSHNFYLTAKANNCKLSEEDERTHPFCSAKLKWMQLMWKSDLCYKQHGVDGSNCSFLMYLSEVENWCPKHSWKGKLREPRQHKISTVQATIPRNIDHLMKVLVDPNARQGYAFIRMRIKRMWSKWQEAIKSLLKKQDLSKRPLKRVLIHLGLLTEQIGWKFSEMQFKGGPLGELVQWSDLISCLYLLGHNISITSETEQLTNILPKLPSVQSPCQVRKDLPFDMIYTDLVGLRQFKKQVKGGYGKFSCLLRIVDSFGTEPAYNARAFSGKYRPYSLWGRQNLQPQQFFTMFPHTPDNSFMGFVVEQHLKETTDKVYKKNQAVVYGKNEQMWSGKANYLSVVKKFADIHGTVHVNYESSEDSYIPSYVINHGLLKWEQLHKLLRESKLFIGLGFPYEGPAPLEAIANGCVFINPRFDPPHSNKNTPFFMGKPTSRSLTSQHPYAEYYIGKPYVYSVNISNPREVESLLSSIMSSNKFEPYIPYEFTEEGMLQRMNAYLERQNFCSFQKTLPKWPPANALRMILGDKGQSCTDVCWKNDRICEPSYFETINSEKAMSEQQVNCLYKSKVAGLYYPAFAPRTMECVFQIEKLLFSCTGALDYLQRLCPCRDYIKGQTALCKECNR